MKTTDAKEKKQLKQLSDEELEKVTGGFKLKQEWGTPEECKNQEYQCSHPEVCHYTCAGWGN